MKKRLVSVLLVAVLSFALASCGSGSGSATTAPENGSTGTAETKTESGEKTVRNIIYTVPAEWTETTKDEDTVYYYPTGNSMDAQLMVMTPDVDPGTTITDEAFFHSCVDGMVNSSEKSTESTRSMETNANGLPYGYVEYSTYINNAPFNVYTALFDCTDGIVGFVFTQSPGLTPGYLDDYRTVIDSINLAGSSEPEEPLPESQQQTETPAENAPPSSGTFVLDLSGLTDADIGPIDTGSLKLHTGDLLEVNYGGDGNVIVKAKIQSMWNNRQTIDQNYFNVSHLIQDNGFDACNELQYWAVADMQSGEEGKVISFRLDTPLIQAVANQSVLPNQLEDYVSDLWILPSLLT